VGWQARYDLKEQQPLNNLDVSTLKALPKREPGWSIKKPESQGIQGIGKPGEQRRPADRGAKPEPLEPHQQEAKERLGRPPPMEVFNQAEQSASEGNRQETKPPNPRRRSRRRSRSKTPPSTEEVSDSPYSQERIEEARKIWPGLTTEQIIWRLKREDERKEDKKHGRRRGFSF
jgi:hypothetical protein